MVAQEAIRVSAPPPAAPPGTVEEAIDVGRSSRFLKEQIPVPVAGGRLVLVRKRRPEGASRGAVLLLHGYAQNRYAWHGSRRSFSAYLAAEGFDVFNVDLRGAGRSREAGTPAARSFGDYVEGDLPAAVRAALAASGERRIFLVGHSLGGALACAFAGRAPEAVRGIVTLSGLYAFARRSFFVRVLGRAAQALERFGVTPYLLPDPLPTDRIGRALAGTIPAWDSPLAALAPLQAWCPGSVEPEILEEAIRRSFEPASLGITLGLAAMARGAGLADAGGRCYLAAFAERTDVPLLVVTANADALVSADDARAAYERSRARDRTLLDLDARHGGLGWGHMDVIVGRSAPRHAWPAVRDWLAVR